VIVDGKDEGRNSYVDALRLEFSRDAQTLTSITQWKKPVGDVTEENDHPPQVGLAHVVVDESRARAMKRSFRAVLVLRRTGLSAMRAAMGANSCGFR